MEVVDVCHHSLQLTVQLASKNVAGLLELLDGLPEHFDVDAELLEQLDLGLRHFLFLLGHLDHFETVGTLVGF